MDFQSMTRLVSTAVNDAAKGAEAARFEGAGRGPPLILHAEILPTSCAST